MGKKGLKELQEMRMDKRGGEFFRGLGVCSLRAFLVNDVPVSVWRACDGEYADYGLQQWTVYEWTMRTLKAE